MYYVVSEICIGWHFLEHWFYFCSQQIISVVVNESLIPNNLIKGGLEKQNHYYYNTECQSKPNQKNVNNAAQFIEQKILFYTNINNKKYV